MVELFVLGMTEQMNVEGASSIGLHALLRLRDAQNDLWR